MRASVIIPMKNAMPYLAETISSLLRQSYGSFEILIVDDGSTDSSRDYVRSITDTRIRLLKNSGTGCAAGFNTGLAEARGEIAMRCDADDLYPVGRIESQVSWLDLHPQVDVVSGYMGFIWTDGTPIAELTRHEKEPIQINAELATGFIRGHNCAMAYRTEVARRIGGMRTWFPVCEDVDFLIRLSELCQIWHVNEKAYVARLRKNSLSRATAPEVVNWYLEQTQLFRRQRLSRGKDDLDLGIPPSLPNWEDAHLRRAHKRSTARAGAASMLIGAAWAEMRAREPVTAMQYALRSIWYRPTTWRTWWTAISIGLKRLRAPWYLKRRSPP